MALSARASKYVSSLDRIYEWVTGAEQTIEYFKKQGIPISETVIAIQVNFSGYKLTISGANGHYFLLNLFSKSEIAGSKQIEVEEYKGQSLFYFGEHQYAQFTFYLTDLGEICTWGNEVVEDKPNIICSSVEKFIEQYALQNEMALQKENPFYYDVIDNDTLTKLLTQYFSEITECSDEYCQWYTNGELTIAKGTWLDRPEFYLHMYGTANDACDTFIDKLKDAKLIG